MRLNIFWAIVLFIVIGGATGCSPSVEGSVKISSTPVPAESVVPVDEDEITLLDIRKQIAELELEVARLRSASDLSRPCHPANPESWSADDPSVMIQRCWHFGTSGTNKAPTWQQRENHLTHKLAEQMMCIANNVRLYPQTADELC